LARPPLAAGARSRTARRQQLCVSAG
jgi:hypothetical protein